MGGDAIGNNEAKGPFEGILGNTIELRVLEHLLWIPTKDFNISELARSAGVSRPAADKVAKKFAEWGIVETLPKRGNMTFYRLNAGSQFVLSIHTFNESASVALCTKFANAIKMAPTAPAPATTKTKRKRRLKAAKPSFADFGNVPMSTEAVTGSIGNVVAKTLKGQPAEIFFRDKPSGP